MRTRRNGRLCRLLGRFALFATLFTLALLRRQSSQRIMLRSTNNRSNIDENGGNHEKRIILHCLLFFANQRQPPTYRSCSFLKGLSSTYNPMNQRLVREMRWEWILIISKDIEIPVFNQGQQLRRKSKLIRPYLRFVRLSTWLFSALARDLKLFWRHSCFSTNFFYEPKTHDDKTIEPWKKSNGNIVRELNSSMEIHTYNERWLSV